MQKNLDPTRRSCFLSLDLEKAFGDAPREIICLTLRQKSVSEYLVNGIMTPYQICKTTISVKGESSGSFSVKVDVHQQATLKRLLFVIVIHVLSKDVQDQMKLYSQTCV